MEAGLKDVDRQGRVVLPAAWRKKHLRKGKVLIRERNGVLEVVPQQDVDLRKYFDAWEVDVKSDLSDWHGVRRELRKR